MSITLKIVVENSIELPPTIRFRMRPVFWQNNSRNSQGGIGNHENRHYL